ncbi:unnamed protein product, partial [Mycena citricolor]
MSCERIRSTARLQNPAVTMAGLGLQTSARDVKADKRAYLEQRGEEHSSSIDVCSASVFSAHIRLIQEIQETPGGVKLKLQ